MYGISLYGVCSSHDTFQEYCIAEHRRPSWTTYWLCWLLFSAVLFTEEPARLFDPAFYVSSATPLKRRLRILTVATFKCARSINSGDIILCKCVCCSFSEHLRPSSDHNQPQTPSSVLLVFTFLSGHVISERDAKQECTRKNT
jgi:hypothetical protein